MADLVVIVPSRGRPAAAKELAGACRATCTADTSLTFAVDVDDPDADRYVAVAELGLASVIVGDHTSMVGALNRRAIGYAGLDDELAVFAVAFMGDDHRPRTMGWDSAYLQALRDLGTGIVFGNDLLQRGNLPTQCAMTSDIIRALGWMAPSDLTHLYVDNFWRDLGIQAGCLAYLPDVVVEHMHPIVGKAAWDEGHVRVNSQAMYSKDRAAYAAYRAERFDADVRKVQALRQLVAG